jgi:hypothetical protein
LNNFSFTMPLPFWLWRISLKGVLLMQLKKITAAVVLGLGLVASAQAEVLAIDWTGNIGYAQPQAPRLEAFTDVVTFTLNADSTGTAYLREFTVSLGAGLPAFFDLSSLSLELYSGSYTEGAAFGPALGQWTATAGASSEDLRLVADATFAAGDYFFVVNGTPNGAFGGSYTLNLNTTPAVPEPSETAMLLAGLGLIGVVARRRAKKA